MEPIDPADLRIAHTDRERVAELLRQAAGDGRIDLDELDERLEATWAAKTFRDLVPITLDLTGQPGHPGALAPRPASAPQRRSAPGTAPTHRSSFAMMAETKRKGPWAVGPEHAATAVMGSVVLDLREARFDSREVTINANAVMGEVKVIVNASTAVVVEACRSWASSPSTARRCRSTPTGAARWSASRASR